MLVDKGHKQGNYRDHIRSHSDTIHFRVFVHSLFFRHSDWILLGFSVSFSSCSHIQLSLSFKSWLKVWLPVVIHLNICQCLCLLLICWTIWVWFAPSLDLSASHQLILICLSTTDTSDREVYWRHHPANSESCCSIALTPSANFPAPAAKFTRLPVEWVAWSQLIHAWCQAGIFHLTHLDQK